MIDVDELIRLADYPANDVRHRDADGKHTLVPDQARAAYARTLRREFEEFARAMDASRGGLPQVVQKRWAVLVALVSSPVRPI